MLHSIDPKLLRQIVLLALILFLASLIVDALLPYMSGVLGALTLYVVLRKWMHKLTLKGWKRTWAAILVITVAFLGICLPLSGVIFMLGTEISNLADKSEQVTQALKEQLFLLEKNLGYDLSSAIDPKEASGWISENVSGFASGTVNAFIALGLLLFILFYMLRGSKEMKNSILSYIPLSKDTIMTLGEEIDRVVRSNAIAIPLVAIVQGFIALIGFYIFGIENPLFWFVITTIGSMIPFVGTLLGIFPVMLLSLASGNDFQAIGIGLYGLIVVGSSDNLIRLFLLKKLDSTHPLVTLLGVIVGLPLFGFLGLIFGPLIINLFIVLVKTYKKKYDLKDDSLADAVEVK